MKKILLCALILGAFSSTLMAAGPWHGNYKVDVRGKSVMFNKTDKTIRDTTTMKIVQIGQNLTITFGTFGGASAATVFKGKADKTDFCANWWHGNYPNQTKVLWGKKMRNSISGKLMYPRTAGGLVPGWTLINFTAYKKQGSQSTSASAASAYPHASAQSSIHVNTKPQLKKRIDPAAVAIKFDIIRRDNQFNGRVRVTGIVKNVGKAPYIDPRGGAGAVRLYRAKPFTAANMVKSAPLRDLKPGQKQYIKHERNWHSSSPSEGEFPPTYWLVIQYDVDITLDGVKTNDDANNSNNRFSASGMAINDLFRKHSGTTVRTMQVKPKQKKRYKY